MHMQPQSRNFLFESGVSHRRVNIQPVGTGRDLCVHSGRNHRGRDIRPVDTGSDATCNPWSHPAARGPISSSRTTAAEEGGRASPQEAPQRNKQNTKQQQTKEEREAKEGRRRGEREGGDGEEKRGTARRRRRKKGAGPRERREEKRNKADPAPRPPRPDPPRRAKETRQQPQRQRRRDEGERANWSRPRRGVEQGICADAGTRGETPPWCEQRQGEKPSRKRMAMWVAMARCRPSKTAGARQGGDLPAKHDCKPFTHVGTSGRGERGEGRTRKTLNPARWAHSTA